MNSQEKVKSETQIDVDLLNDLIVDAMQDIKARKVVKMDLRGLDDRPTDFFIVCEADTFVQIRAIANNIHRRVKDEHYLTPSHFEGREGAQWILVDYFTTVAHIFHPEARMFYEIEELWGDANFTEYEDI